MTECVVRRGGCEDLEVVIAVERACGGKAPHWSDAIWANVLGDDAGRRVVLMAEVAESVVGFVVVGIRGEAAEMESVAVLPAARRQGVGRALCGAAMAWARAMNAEAMDLEVRASNVVAIELYRSFGFVEQGRRKGYYRGPMEDAVMMGVVL